MNIIEIMEDIFRSKYQTKSENVIEMVEIRPNYFIKKD